MHTARFGIALLIATALSAADSPALSAQGIGGKLKKGFEGASKKLEDDKSSTQSAKQKADSTKTKSVTAASTSGYPTISARQFAGGSAKMIVTGSFSINEDVPINTQASYGDGEVTWLQFGVSGSAQPNGTITFGENKEIGITVGRGKLITTGGITVGEKSSCSGTVDVTGRLISGHYTCRGLSSHDAATGKLGKVDVEVTFTAKS